MLVDKNIDTLYLQGNISDVDYGKYYLDPTRTYVPSFIEEDLSDWTKVFQETMRREKVVQNKNLMLHNINTATKFFEQ